MQKKLIDQQKDKLTDKCDYYGPCWVKVEIKITQYTNLDIHNLDLRNDKDFTFLYTVT